MHQNSHYYIYKEAIHKVIDNEEQLPSLPSITIKIRQAISDPHTNLNLIAKLIKLDPSLSTLLLKLANSPIYLRPVPPKTIEAIIAMIGLPALEKLVMTHSIKSLFVLKNPVLKKLFKLSWERMIYKAAISQFLAKKLGFRPCEEAMSASILTEVGTLGVLSAFNSNITVPDADTYFKLCRLYSKSLSTILLRKWGLESYLIKVTESCGQWGFQHSKKLALIDIINLAIYSTVKHQSVINDLPPIEELASYQKLPASLNALTEAKQLVIIQNNLQQIERIIGCIR